MENNSRISVVDALRGFALAGIILIHSMEHFDFFHPPEINFLFSAETDSQILTLGFLLIGGKAYSIFSMMFGLSFFIQLDRHSNPEINFSGKFIWRLTILFLFGFIHSLFYQGDILLIYSVFGLTLVFFNKFKNKILTVLAILFALQIPLLTNIIFSFLDPNFVYSETFGQSFWGEGAKAFSSGSFWDVLSFNIVKGRSAVWGWTFYNGRYLQLIALFIIGLLIGRSRIFENVKANSAFFRKALLAGIIGISLLYIISNILDTINLNEVQKNLIHKVVRSFYDLSFTVIIVSVFTLIYQRLQNLFIFEYLAAFGRMSLTNYVSQSIIGVFLFYNWGLGLYRYMGITWSLIYGLLFLICQMIFSKYWLSKNYYGPLEWLWRALTLKNFSIKLKR